MQAQLFKLLAHADLIDINGYEISQVEDKENGTILLECDEDDAWLVRDQTVEYDKEGMATIQARHLSDEDESNVVITLSCTVPLPLVYSPESLA